MSGYRFFTEFGLNGRKSIELDEPMIEATSAAQVPMARARDREPELWAAAQKLEATFLAEMLKATGLGEIRSEFGGGTGEEQFASFLRQAHAERIVAAGGVGLAQSIFETLKERSDAPVSQS